MPIHHRVAGVWRRADAAPIPGGQDQIAYRNSLTYGQYIPTGANSDPVNATTGVPSDVTLTEYNDPAVDKLQLRDGTVITEKIIYGDITPLGDVQLNSCLLVGGTSTPTSDIGVITCFNTRGGKIYLNDTTIKPRVEKLARNGIQGRQFEAWRCDISGGTDCIGVFSQVPGTPVAAKIVGCYLHDMSYYYPDYITTSHDDGAHTDCIQYQGGRDLWVMGNMLEGSAHTGPGSGTNPSKPWVIPNGWNNGACIIMQKNSTCDAPDQSVIVEQNWLTGGLSQLNGKSTATSYVYRNNKHYRNAASNASPKFGPYWIRFDAGTNISGITGIDTTNTWVDGPYAGTVMTQTTDHGILIG